MPSSQAAMVRLLAAQARRRGFHRPQVWTALSALLFLAPTGVAGMYGATHSLEVQSFVYAFAIIMAGLLPLAQLWGDASLLASLRRGRCLEEIVGTRTPSSEIVDQVASFSVLSVLKMGCAVVAPLAAGLLIVVPAEQRLLLLGGCVLWFPVAAALVLVESYVVQADTVWTRHGAVHLAAVLVAAMAGFGVSGAARAPDPTSLVGIFGVMLALGIAARWLAILGLDRAGEPQALGRSTSSGRTGRFSLGVGFLFRDNPIALREGARRRSLFGRLGRYWPIWLCLVVVLAWAAGLDARDGEQAALGLVVLIVSLQPLLASAQTARAVLQEREGGTLEALASTGLEARTFVDGWAVAAWGPRLVQTVLVVAAGAAVLVGSGNSTLGPGMFLLVYIPDALVRIVFGAYLGLVVSCLAKARRDMWGLLFLLWVGSSMVLTTASGMLMAGFMFLGFQGPGMVIVAGAQFFVVTGMTLVATLGVRWLATSQVRTLLGPHR